MQNPKTDKPPQHTPPTCAVVVTRNPTEIFSQLLQQLQRQVQQIIVVDNATDTSNRSLQESKTHPNITFIQNPENLGMGRALNQGFEVALNLGFEWAISFDQDSRPDADTVEQLHHTRNLHEYPESIAIVAPQIIDINSGRISRFLVKKYPFFYRRLECEKYPFQEVTYAITSGAMIKLEVFNEMAGFKEDYFIDYIDTEFCLRALLNGYKTLATCRANLYHSFGNRKSVRVGFFTLHPSFHSAERWYTIGRNRIQMIKSYGVKIPHWLLYEIVATGFTLVRMLLTEDLRTSKLSALVRGTWDGCRGKLGKPQWADTDIGNSS